MDGIEYEIVGGFQTPRPWGRGFTKDVAWAMIRFQTPRPWGRVKGCGLLIIGLFFRPHARGVECLQIVLFGAIACFRPHARGVEASAILECLRQFLSDPTPVG